MEHYRMVRPEDKIDSEDYLSCPYDETHIIKAKRYTRHLWKCMKNHRGRDFVTCEFHSWHIMKKPLMEHHMRVCPFRKQLELEPIRELMKISFDNAGRCYLDNTNYREFHVPQTEWWDDDEERAAINKTYGVDERGLLAINNNEDFKIPQTECWDDEIDGIHRDLKQGSTTEFRIPKTECWDDGMKNRRYALCPAAAHEKQ